MATRRSKDLQVNLEPMVHQLVMDLAARMENSASGYVRDLIVQDLRDKGLLTDSMLADMVLASK
jgi:ribosomal protein L17